MQYLCVVLPLRELWWPVGTQLECELTVGGRLLVGVLLVCDARWFCAEKLKNGVVFVGMLHEHNCILLKMSIYGSKHAEE